MGECRASKVQSKCTRQLNGRKKYVEMEAKRRGPRTPIERGEFAPGEDTSAKKSGRVRVRSALLSYQQIVIVTARVGH